MTIAFFIIIRININLSFIKIQDYKTWILRKRRYEAYHPETLCKIAIFGKVRHHLSIVTGK